MREMPLGDYVAAVAAHLGRGHERRRDTERLERACAIAQEKAQTLAEVWPLIGFLFEPPVDDPKAWRKVMGEGAQARLEAALDVIRGVEPFDAPTLEAELGSMVERLGARPRDVYQPLRVAITGTAVSPGIFDSLAALGRERTVERVEAALERLRAGDPALDRDSS